MPSWLKQSTSVDVGIGPFLDETDGKTAETALTITQPDIRLKKNGGAWAQKNAAQTLSHEEAGWYELTLDATDTNTLGLLIVAIHESGALPVWKEYMVVPAMIYDSIVAGTDRLDTNVTHVGDTAQTAGDIIGDTNDIQTRLPAALVSGRIDASVGAMAANVITAAATAADFTTEVTTGLSTLDAAGVRAAVGLAAANLDTQLTAIDDYLDTEVAAIKAKTDNLPAAPAATGDIPSAASIADAVWDEALSGHAVAGSTGAMLSDGTSALGVNTNDRAADCQSRLQVIDDFLDTEVAAIKAKTDSLTFTVAGQVDANIQYVNDVLVNGTGAAGNEWGP